MESGGSSDTPKRVFIVEDHPVFREGLVQILEDEPGLVVCGQARDAEEALKNIPEARPDLVLVDITLPGKSGLDLIREVRARDRSIKLLAVSMHDEALYADRVLRAGGDGYIMKQEDPEELVRAMRDVLAGRIYVSEDVMAGMAKAPAGRPTRTPSTPVVIEFTDTELGILRELGLGKTESEIARNLALTPRLVATHCVQLRRRLGFKTANALIRYAVCLVETGGG